MDSSLDMIILSCAGYHRTDFKLSPARGLLLARITRAEASSERRFQAAWQAVFR
jgi:hypothetical protein